jgi:Ni,Fe-hydrogenase III component G
MEKPLLLLMAPVNTVSGYGARSRDVAHALIASDKYNVKIWPTRWGSTPQNYLNDHDQKDKLIIDRCLPDPNLPKQPDLFIQITVPNEFQKIGKVNIGITAGIETTMCAAPWIEGINKMDLVLTSTEHSKNVLQNTIFEKIDNQTKQKIGALQCTTQVEVLLEGVDLTTYFKTKEIHKSVNDQLIQIKEDFGFLFVGHWLKGDFGEDRKNISGLIKCFLETFYKKARHNRPALLLKTSAADFSPVDRSDIMLKIKHICNTVNGGKNLPNIYFIHGDLTNDEMNSLYNHPKVKAHVTFTKGEGFGRPLAEASLSEKVIIAPNWSGQADFLKHGIYLEGQLTNVHPSAVWENVILAESQWFSVNYKHAADALKYVYDKKNKKALNLVAKRQAKFIQENFAMKHMEEQLIAYLDKYAPTEVSLNLPKLKKVTPNKPKLELPKLKKVES